MSRTTAGVQAARARRACASCPAKVPRGPAPTRRCFAGLTGEAKVGGRRALTRAANLQAKQDALATSAERTALKRPEAGKAAPFTPERARPVEEAERSIGLVTEGGGRLRASESGSRRVVQGQPRAPTNSSRDARANMTAPAMDRAAEPTPSSSAGRGRAPSDAKIQAETKRRARRSSTDELPAARLNAKHADCGSARNRRNLPRRPPKTSSYHPTPPRPREFGRR